MNENELYEKQYGQQKLINKISFPQLRKIFKQYDHHREDLVLSLLDTAETLLDVGCSDGSLILKARNIFKEIYGIDISQSRINNAKQITAEKFPNDRDIHLSVCNINNKIDFPDDLFDVVTSIAVIEHIFDPYFVVGEIHRVLKKDGIFIVNVPNIAYIKHRIRLLFGHLPVTSSAYNWKEIGWDGGHLHYFTRKTFCKLLQECGFEIIKVTGSGLFANLRNFYPSLLTGDICIKAKKN